MKILTHKSACIILIIVTIFSVFATGCSFLNKNGSVDEQKNGLESGFFNQSDGCIPSENNFYAAYKSDKNEFDIDDVTLEFYYGGIYRPHLGIDYYLQHESYPSFDIYFSYNHGEKILVKHVEENLISEKYLCEAILDEDGYIDEIRYKHHETLTIPKECFTKDSDIIRFEICATNVVSLSPEYKTLETTNIFYKIKGDKVILSAKPFE